MILKRLKSNSSFNLFFIPVAVLAFWVKSLLHPFIYDFATCEKTTVLFTPIAKMVGDNSLMHVVVSVVLVILLSFLMQAINDRYAFIRIRSKLPSTLFAIVLGGFVGMHTLHPVYFSALFLLLAIFRLFSMFEKIKAYSAVFDVGILLGISALFCVNLIVLLPAFLIGVAILGRETRWREFVILISGFLLPFIFVVSYSIFTDTFIETLNNFTQNIVLPINHFKGNYILQVYLGILILYTLIGSVDLIKQYDNKKISSRKYFTAFFWMFLFSVIGFVFVPGASQEMLVISAIPVTFLMSNFFVFMKKRFWSELLFVLFLLLVVFIQFAESFFNG